MKRRTFLLTGAAATIALPAMADAEPILKVVKTPTCGCCTAWVDHVRQAGFQVEAQDVDQDALYALKNRLQIAPELAGCHTAVVGDYFIEGHVPAEDIARLLSEQPAARGLSASGNRPRSSRRKITRSLMVFRLKSAVVDERTTKSGKRRSNRGSLIVDGGAIVPGVVAVMETSIPSLVITPGNDWLSAAAMDGWAD